MSADIFPSLLSPDLIKVKDTDLVDTATTVSAGYEGLRLQNIILGGLELLFRNMPAQNYNIITHRSRQLNMVNGLLRLRLTWIVAQPNCFTGDVLETFLAEGVLVREQTWSGVSKGKYFILKWRSSNQLSLYTYLFS